MQQASWDEGIGGSNYESIESETKNLHKLKGSKKRAFTATKGATKFVDCWTVTGKFVARFETVAVAASALGIPVVEISSCCRGVRDVVRELFRFRFAGESLELAGFHDETRSSSRAAARGSFRLGADADAAEDEEPALKKSKSRTAKNTTPSGSYGAKQSTYFVDEKEEAELRLQLRNVRPRRWTRRASQADWGDWGQGREASSPFSTPRWQPRGEKTAALLPLLLKEDDPITQGFSGLLKKSWRESRGLAPKDSVTLQMVPPATAVLRAADAASFDVAAAMGQGAG